MQRREGVVAAGACLIVAAACVGLASRSGTIPAAGTLLAPGDAADRKLLQLGGLIGEVSAVKHALLAIAGRERGQPQQLTGGRPALSGGLPAPVHTDSFDYPASVGGASQIQHGEWSRRSGNDDRLEMIPRRSKLRRIDKLVAQDACNWPECVTRSGLAPGTDLFPGELAGVTRALAPRRDFPAAFPPFRPGAHPDDAYAVHTLCSLGLDRVAAPCFPETHCR